jgi:hypothetical protein
MKNLSGTYRAVGANSITGREFYGDLELVQHGSALHGSYRFSTSWDDPSPVPFGLPEHDCNVEGELAGDGAELEVSDEEAFQRLLWAQAGAIRPDAVLRLGGEQIYVVALGDGTLVNASNPTMTLQHAAFGRVRDGGHER